MSRPDYDVEDLVVCVVAGKFTCEHGVIHSGIAAPKMHEVSQVAGLEPVIIEWGRGTGSPCGCIEVALANGKRGAAQRFRKLDPKPRAFWAGEIEADQRETV